MREERYDVEGVGPPFGPRGAGRVEVREYADQRMAVVERHEWSIEELLPDRYMIEAADPQALLQYVKDRLTLAMAKELAARLEWEIRRSGLTNDQGETIGTAFRAKYQFIVVRQYIEEEDGG